MSRVVAVPTIFQMAKPKHDWRLDVQGWTFVLFWSKTSLKTLRPRTSSFRFLLKTAPINPIGLIPTRSHRFNKSIDQKIIFQSHAELSDRPSLGNLVGNLQDK